MYQCISDFVQNQRENGLLLLDMPTGSGKTYSVLKYIADFISDDNNKGKRIFFLTTLKKNLPLNKLKEQLDKLGKSHIFQERVLELKPNADIVIKNYHRDILREIPDEIRRSKEFKDFKADVVFLKENTDSELVRSIKNNFSSNTEPAFRKYLQKILFRRFSNVNDRIYAIKTDSDWQWIGKLYPAVFTREKQVIFMSMDKFICPHSTLVEKNYMFYNSSIINGATVFIDEFDATKETVLKNIIENSLKEKIDYIELFNNIYAILQNKTFPERFFIPSEKRKEGIYRNQSLKGVMNELKKKADDIFDTYLLQFNHKTDSNDRDDNNFLFSDHRYISILNGQNRFISTYNDKNDKINKIVFSVEKPEDQNSIQSLLGKLWWFTIGFQVAVYIFANNYYQVRKERIKDGEEEFTFESAIHSVLTEFNLGSTYENYLFSQIMMMRTNKRNDIAGSEYDFSIYENGFRYFAFENSPNHDFKSVISMISFSQTPEKILTKLCEKAKVIGISATATFPSVLCNYDLNYLSVKMSNAYSHISSNDMKRLKDRFMQDQKGYNDIEIHTELFESSDYSISSWNNILNDEELAKAVYEDIERSLSGNGEISNNTFRQERYYKIAMAFKRFMQNPDIRSFLCILNKFPTTNDRDLNINTLYSLFYYIAGKDVRKSIALLDSNDYENKKNILLARLTDGEKLFVISTYQTIGAGQNIQYDIPEDLKGSLIKINDRDASLQKDFDAIYLDKPTNLTVNLNSSETIEDNDFIKYIFETEFLQENAEISEETARQNIKDAFARSRCGVKKYTKGYKTQSVGYYATRQIVQTIGRMCRTNMKQKNIYIFADVQICELFRVGIVDDRLLNFEVLALIDEIKKYGSTDMEGSDLIWKNELSSVRVNKFIKNMLHQDWNDKTLEEWGDLRNLGLAKPMPTEEDYKSDFRISQFYVRMDKPRNKYYYAQSEDYNKIKISFVPTTDIKQEVSEQSAKLDRIMMFKGIKEFFQRKGWATSFEPSIYNMSPTFFNNIYKGALGEATGWYWFKNVLGIQLDEIKDPEIFEMFDYVVPDIPIYVDFKNWHETTKFDEDKELEKVINKATECNAKCVIVANILSETKYDVKITHHGDITVIRCPSLITDNITSVDVNEEVALKIRRCINEISNQNE